MDGQHLFAHVDPLDRAAGGKQLVRRHAHGAGRVAAGGIESVPAGHERGRRVCIYSQDALVTSVYAASGYEEGRGADVIAESRQIEAIGEAVKGGGKLILVKG